MRLKIKFKRERKRERERESEVIREETLKSPRETKSAKRCWVRCGYFFKN